MEKIDEHKAFGGWQRRYTHASKVCNCDMTFALYVPPQADTQRVPVVYWLSGLTCTDENFVNKAGAQRVAAELGVAVVAPDTSPRGDDVADEDFSEDDDPPTGTHDADERLLRLPLKALGLDLKEAVRAGSRLVEEALITEALEQTQGNVTRSARLLGISRRSLQSKMKELGLRES